MNTESIDVLIRLGYTREEAEFMHIVAVHSGYFTHRQFLNYSQTKPGKHSQKFLAKLLAERHATHHTYQCGGRIYHIFSRKVFKAIGFDNLRTRRRHQLEYIRTRLVALDFVLSNPDRQYLQTEADKVSFFEDRLGVNGDVLPSKMYASTATSSKTTRYFVDRFPMFLRDVSSPLASVTLTYVDEGCATLAGFTTHLQAYAGLLRSLPRFEFIYVSPSDRFFHSASSEFSRIVLGTASLSSKDDLIRYFRLRSAWEASERVAAVDVLFLNAAKARFRDQKFEVLYKRWAQGIVTDDELSSPLNSPAPVVRGTFSTCKCGESLSIFTHPSQELEQGNTELGPECVSPQLSPRVSPL
jgi:hypothetical protein